jgi:hypothetical protein
MTKPVAHSAFSRLSITQITPQGWIREFLCRQKLGLTGHIAVAGYPFDTCLWAGDRMEGSPTAWWPYEQTAYFLDGALRLGHLLGDDELLGKVRSNFDYIRDHVSASGRYGTELSERYSHWPYASFNRALMCEHGVTGDDTIVELLHRHYLTFAAEDFADVLELANVEPLCWLYEKTADPRMLEMAQAAYALFRGDPRYRNWAGGDIDFSSNAGPSTHGVVYLELVKIPALLYRVSGARAYLDDAIKGLQTMERDHLLVSGLPSSTEHFAGQDAGAGTETCNTATFPYTYGTLLQITGDAHYGDAIEKAVFNGGLGAISKDFRAHQYFSAPNQAVCALDSNPYGHHAARMAYLPGHDVECCTGNVNRFMPYYVEQMWLATPDHGLVAALLGPCTVVAEVGAEATLVTLEELTGYPFSESIVFKLGMLTSTRFPLSIRIPAWCQRPELWLNGNLLSPAPAPGQFHRIDRVFADGDQITLKLPMEVRLSAWPKDGVAVERGPLVYSLPVQSVDEVIANHPKSGAQFPAIARRPGQPWNYALCLDEEASDSISVAVVPATDYPWERAPVKIAVPARRVPAWQLHSFFDDRLGAEVTTTPGFPDPIDATGETEVIELVPYGSTLLRITVFPKLPLNKP